jgi:hypothetical protein
MSQIIQKLESLETMLPCRRELPERIVGQEILVRDPDTGQVHFLNPTAGLVWQSCDGKTSLGECVRLLRAKFDVPEEADIAADVSEIVADFAQRGILDVSHAVV